LLWLHRSSRRSRSRTPDGIYNPTANSVGDTQGIDNPKASAAAGFAGPLDVIASATACYSLRACSAALRGTKAVNACNSTSGGDVCVDLLTHPTTGNLVSQAVNGGTCPGALCTIKTWYDQTAGNACNAASCDLTQATVASRQTLVANVLGSLPAAHSNGATPQAAAAANGIALNQPISMSVVARRTTGTSLGLILGAGNAPNNLAFDASTNVGMFSSATVDFSAGSAAENAFHNIMGVFNGASSIGQLNATITNPVASNPGATNWTVGLSFLSLPNASFSPTMDFVEGIIWSGDLHTSFTALCHNQFTYWGTSVSC
jgi:hypothetical protein